MSSCAPADTPQVGCTELQSPQGAPGILKKRLIGCLRAVMADQATGAFRIQSAMTWKRQGRKRKSD